MTRTPPHSREAEESVLGAVLLDSSLVARINALNTEDFYTPAHSAIFEAMRRLSTTGSPVDAVTVADDLRRVGELEKVGGIPTLAHLADTVPAPSNIDYYIGLVTDASRRRRLIRAGGELQALGYNGEPVDVLEAKAVELVAGTAGGRRFVPDSWRSVDLAAVMRGIADGTIERPTPTVGARSDGAGLFYAGRLNTLFGRYGSAKSFVAQVVTIQEIEAGRRVWWVDFEDDPYGMAERLHDLGADPDLVAGQVRYLNPFEALTPSSVKAVAEDVIAEQPSLVVIDSGGEWMALQGVQPNHDEEVGAFYKTFVGPFTRAGAAVVTLDHVPHDASDKLRPINSQRKMAAVRGVAYLVEIAGGLELGRGKVGKAKLTSAKDALGHYPKRMVVAELTIDATAHPYTVTVDAVVASTGGFRPTNLMEKASDLLSSHPEGLSLRNLRDGFSGKREYKEQAIALLVGEGFITVEKKAGAHVHTLVRPYLGDDDPTVALIEEELGAELLPDPFEVPA